MALKAYRFVGLDRDVYLPDDIEVIIDIIPASMIGWVRSGTRNAPDYSTWHDTGNPGSTALAEARYLHGGPRDGNGNRYLVGYNFAVDDKRIVQITPLNEDTWAAGTPSGNHTSWHVEQCFGPGIDFDRSTRNCAALHGGLIAAMPGWAFEPSLVQHNVWYGKDCPGQLRRMGRWAQAKAQAASFFALARQAAGGAVVPEKPTPKPDVAYAGAVPIPALGGTAKPDRDTAPSVVLDGGTTYVYVGDRVRCTQPTARYQRVVTPGERWVDVPRVGPDIEPGEEFDVTWLAITPEGHRIFVTPFWTRVMQGHTERISDAQAA